MKKITIHTPIWKTRSIGIAEHKIIDNLRIEIDYIDKKGERLYPYIYTTTRDKLMRCPIQIVKGVKLRLIPIADLQIVKEIK